MKVALVSNFPIYSGTGKVPYQLWRTIKDRKLIQVDFFLTHFMNRKDHDLLEYKQKGVRVLQPFDYMASPVLSRLMLYFADPFLLPAGYDLYHFGNHMLGRFARFRKPSVVTVHDVLQFRYREKFKNPLTTRIYNHFMLQSIKSLAFADHLICVSNWSKGEFLKQFSLMDPSKVSVVYNGVDHAIFSPRQKLACRRKLGLPLDKKIILNLGSEIARKQVSLLIRSFAEIKKSDEEILLLRHGEKTDSSTKLIKELGLETSVIYRDDTPEQNLPDYYSAADVLVVTSSEEGFCLPIIEAMACGLPVVTTSRTSLPEVTGGAEAAIIQDLTTESVVDAVQSALNMDSDRRELIRQKGFKNAARFSWAESARRTVEIYQKVLKI